jgi:preprotein translocase subunit SecF
MFPLKLVPDNTNIRFLSYRWWALAASIILLTGSVALVAVSGLNLGVDFVGGQMFRVSFSKPANVDDLRVRIGALNLGDAAIQQFGSPNQVSIRMQLPPGNEEAANAAASRVRAAVRAGYADAKFDAVETVSGKVSGELLRQGAIALALAMIGIALFIWMRFEWQFGVGALVTLLHDVVLTFGFFALTQLEFNLNVVAAILTIIGYSLNDTIVIYDRIRENLKKWRKMAIEPLLDLSINETLSRTMVTSLSILLTLAILLVLGPDVIFGFTAAMLLGIVIGTLSSVYVSASILIWLGVGPDSFLPGATKDNAERVTRPEGFVK